ncbi:MAG TPA: hypothetical protein VGF07_02590 [Stellaceae bacterium]
MPPCLALAGWVVAGVVLAGCATAPGAGKPPAGPSPLGAIPDGGIAVPPEAARILTDAPAGAQLSYRLADGRRVMLALSPIHQSGLGDSCRVGRTSANLVGAATPTAYAFCRRDGQWYQTPPVVVSGY